jgi:hypothetical protein
MNIATMLNKLITYIGDAATRIFARDRTTVPKIGVQPFDGEVNQHPHED